MKQSWRYGAAVVRSEYVDGLHTLTLCGPVTRAVMQQIAVDQAVHIRAPCHAVVSDWRRAIVALSVPDMVEIGRSLSGQPVMAVPAIIITSPEALPLFQEYAYHLMQIGVIRGATLSADHAFSWAARQRAFVAPAPAMVQLMPAMPGWQAPRMGSAVPGSSGLRAA